MTVDELSRCIRPFKISDDNISTVEEESDVAEANAVFIPDDATVDVISIAELADAILTDDADKSVVIPIYAAAAVGPA